MFIYKDSSCVCSVVITIWSSGCLTHVWSTCWLGHDNLINLQYGQNSVYAEFQGPCFGFPSIENLKFCYVLNLSVCHVDTKNVALTSFGVHISDNGFWFVASILSNNSWNDFECLTESLNGILVKTWLGL